MKTLPLLLLNAAVAAAVAAAALLLLAPGPAGGSAARRPAPAATDADAAGRVRALEARVEEMRASLDLLREEFRAERDRAAARESALRAEVETGRREVDAARALLDGAGVPDGPGSGDRAKPPEMDAFAQEVSKAMKKGISQEFRRIADLVTAPTPEALELRRRQLKMFAAAMGTNAGLDQAEVAVFEGILNETDERAREDLRPLLQGVEDYAKVDYPKVKKVTADAFAGQDARIAQEFPKEKSERLRQQLEPVRNLFGAMLDELERQGRSQE